LLAYFILPNDNYNCKEQKAKMIKICREGAGLSPAKERRCKKVEREVLVTLAAREIKKTLKPFVEKFKGREKEVALLLLDVIQEACDSLKSQVKES